MALTNTAAVLVFAVLVAISSVSGQSNCPNGDDYLPCTCSGAAGSKKITCSGVPMAEVKEIFSSKTSAVFELLEIDLRPAASDVDGIPLNVLGNKRARSISIRCPVPTFELKIHRDAFRFSQYDTSSMLIQYCDLSSMTFSFLEDFDALNSLSVTSSTGLNRCFPTLRALPSLKSLSFYNSKGLVDLVSYPIPLISNLTLLDVGSNSLDDTTAYNLLDWVAGSSSGSLDTIYMDSNQLTRVPPQVTVFNKLNILDLSYNRIGRINTGELTFSVPVLRLYLSGNGIDTIRPGAFVGDFSRARVQVQSNKLTSFDASVFQQMMIQMANGTGSLFASANPYDCSSNPCHLSWLTKYNRDLLKQVDLITCSNGIRVADLPENNFASCPFSCGYDGPQKMSDCHHQYYHCSNLVPYVMNCTAPTLLAFNPVVNVCDFRTNIPACFL